MPSFTKIMATMALALLPLTAGAPIPSSSALSSPFNAAGLVRRADAIVEPTYEGEQDFKDSFDDLEVEGDYELITEETDESALEKRGKRRWSGTATWVSLRNSASVQVMLLNLETDCCPCFISHSSTSDRVTAAGGTRTRT